MSPGAALSKSPIRILIAEDSPTQAQRLQHILVENGYEVGVATNGRMALEMAPHFQPELIVSDVVMPEMGGYELCTRIKADAELKHIPVILVTTMSDPQDVISGLECGADNFVLKPYDAEYLLNHLRYVLVNRQMRRSTDVGMGVEIHFNGNRHFITADRLQILNLLLSTYDGAIHRNRELKISQAELEQRAAETSSANRFLQSVIDNIPDMLFVKDAADLSFVRLNRAGEEMLGYSQQEVLGRFDHDFFPAHEADFFTSTDREVLALGVMKDIPEETLHTRNKGVRLLRTKKIPIFDVAGKPQYLLGISEDVTEQKEREREILRLNAALEQRTAEADAANRAKSSFLATMSHEIRTPINGMFGMLELLGLTNLDAEQRGTLEVVRESGRSLLRIIDDILDFSKVEAGMLEVRPEPTSIVDLIDVVHKVYAGPAQRKGLRLECSVDPRISPALLVDPLRLRQILDNFTSNALKFTAQGSIEIKAELIGRDAERDNVRLSVHDTGIGVSEENQRRLFKPFSQGETDTAQRFGGTGLGLVICRRLAELMGGSVEMMSEPGKGTTLMLTLTLPTVDSTALRKAAARRAHDTPSTVAQARRHAPSTDEAQAQGTLILVVDDHPTNRMLLMRQVRALGYAAETAESGTEALERWQSGRYGLVITDCNMAGMDGFELTRNIRQLEAASGGQHTPIIACTANALAGAAEACFAAGMDDYLAKPVDLPAMLEKLDRWLPLPHGSEISDEHAPRLGAAHGAGALDRSFLLELVGGDAESARDILAAFRRTNGEDVDLLERAVAASDIAQTQAASHRIKGASRAVGAGPLAETCERIENASRAKDLPAIADGIHAFRQEWLRLQAWFDAIDDGSGDAQQAGSI